MYFLLRIVVKKLKKSFEAAKSHIILCVPSVSLLPLLNPKTSLCDSCHHYMLLPSLICPDVVWSLRLGPYLPFFSVTCSPFGLGSVI